jgi:tetratricopeptide (TPR) repeat protein/peroxiredoxin
MAAVDWDFDGDLDLWLSNRTAPRLRMMRNDDGDRNHFIAVSLRGVTANRDAIGARLEARTGDRLQIRTLVAGDAYLSQSSKWLHVGLGDAQRVDELTVRWPGGAAQTFADVKADCFYHLTQGQTLSEWTPPRRGSAAEPGEQHAHEPTQRSRIRPVARAPMPTLEWHDMAGRPQRLDDIKQPVLINLWASWCAPCIVELSAFKDHAREFSDAGLSVVALSVDGLIDQYDTDRDDAIATLDKFEWPMASGMANATLLDKLQLIHDSYMFRTLESFPVPTSFLVDDQGRVAAIYLGPVDVDRLMRDVATLNQSGDARQFATPLTGRWIFPVHSDRLDDLARSFAEAGYGDDMLRYLDAMKATPRGVGNEDMVQNLLRLGETLLTSDKPTEAMEQYEKVLQYRDDNPFAHYGLAMALRSLQRLDEAIQQLHRTVELSPEANQPRRALATVLIEAGRYDESWEHLEWLAAHGQPQVASRIQTHVSHLIFQQGRVDVAGNWLKRAIEHDPDNLPAVMGLMTVRLAQGRTDDAIAVIERAIEAHPEQPALREALNNLKGQQSQAAP